MGNDTHSRRGQLTSEEIDAAVSTAPKPAAFVSAGSNAFDANVYAVLAALYAALRAGHGNIVPERHFAQLQLDKEDLRTAFDELDRFDWAMTAHRSGMIKPAGILAFERMISGEALYAVNRKRREILARFSEIKREHEYVDLASQVGTDPGLFSIALDGLDGLGLISPRRVMGPWPATSGSLTREGLRFRTTRGEPDTTLPIAQPPSARPPASAQAKPMARPKPSSVSSSFKTGDVVGPWRLGKPRKRGGQGEVWEVRANDEQHTVPRAMKIVSAANAKARARFQREVEFLKELDGEPHVINVHDFSLEWIARVPAAPDAAFLVMDLAAGSLADLALTESNPLLALQFFSQACAGIAAMHARQMLHRDISPGNFLVLREPSRVVVTDLGIATKIRDDDDAGSDLESQLTGIYEGGGTEHYRAVEVVQGGLSKATQLSDIYALGRVLEMLLTRETPTGIEAKPVPRGHQLSAAACVALDSVIERATSVKPSERFQSVADLVSVLPKLSIDLDRGSQPASVHEKPSMPLVIEIEPRQRIPMRGPGDKIPLRLSLFNESQRVLKIRPAFLLFEPGDAPPDRIPTVIQSAVSLEGVHNALTGMRCRLQARREITLDAFARTQILLEFDRPHAIKWRNDIALLLFLDEVTTPDCFQLSVIAECFTAMQSMHGKNEVLADITLLKTLQPRVRYERTA